jgi:hypothetical protein
MGQRRLEQALAARAHRLVPAARAVSHRQLVRRLSALLTAAGAHHPGVRGQPRRRDLEVVRLPLHADVRALARSVRRAAPSAARSGAVLRGLRRAGRELLRIDRGRRQSLLFVHALQLARPRGAGPLAQRRGHRLLLRRKSVPGRAPDLRARERRDDDTHEPRRPQAHRPVVAHASTRHDGPGTHARELAGRAGHAGARGLPPGLRRLQAALAAAAPHR